LLSVVGGEHLVDELLDFQRLSGNWSPGEASTSVFPLILRMRPEMPGLSPRWPVGTTLTSMSICLISSRRSTQPLMSASASLSPVHARWPRTRPLSQRAARDVPLWRRPTFASAPSTRPRSCDRKASGIVSLPGLRPKMLRRKSCSALDSSVVVTNNDGRAHR
jgi:hypothetical protein